MVYMSIPPKKKSKCLWLVYLSYHPLNFTCVEENEEVKLLWDFTIQTDREIHCGHSCSRR